MYLYYTTSFFSLRHLRLFQLASKLHIVTIAKVPSFIVEVLEVYCVRVILILDSIIGTL